MNWGTGIAALGGLWLSYGYLPTIYYKHKWKQRKVINTDRLYLTFDDGPDPRYTPALLDLLAELKIPATFFVVAEFAACHPILIDRMRREGHCVGIHSTSHKSAFAMTPLSIKQDFTESISLLCKLGHTPQYYRPPWGQQTLMTRIQAKRHGLRVVLWDVMAEDWTKDTTPEQIVQKLLSRAQYGSVICLHDGRGRNEAPAKMLEALKRVLPRWLAEGKTFGTIEDFYADKKTIQSLFPSQRCGVFHSDCADISCHIPQQ